MDVNAFQLFMNLSSTILKGHFCSSPTGFLRIFSPYPKIHGGKYAVIKSKKLNLRICCLLIRPIRKLHELNSTSKKVKWHFKLKCSQKRISSISWIWNMMIVFVLLDPPVLTYHLRLDFFSIRFNRLYC